MERNDIKSGYIKIKDKKRLYYSINLGKNSNNNIIFYFTETGCHDPSINASSLFDNSNLNATVFILPKVGVVKNQFGASCSPEYIENDNLKKISNDTEIFINKKLVNIPKIKNQKVILYGESEGADVAVRLAKKIKRVTDIIITHRGMGLSNSDERKLSHQIRFNNKKIKNIDSIRLTKIANGFSYSPETIIFKRKAKNWEEFFSIDKPPIKNLYESKKNVFIYLGKKDLVSPFYGVLLSMDYFCDRKNENLTVIVDNEAGHKMVPYFMDFSKLKKTIEQWIIGVSSNKKSYKYPLEELKCK